MYTGMSFADMQRQQKANIFQGMFAFFDKIWLQFYHHYFDKIDARGVGSFLCVSDIILNWNHNLDENLKLKYSEVL